MAITLGSIKKGKADKPPLCVFYGVAGVGKTELAASAPAPIFMRTAGEDYSTGIEPEEFPEAATFSDVIEAIGVLANEEHSFQTFAIDSVDGLESLIFAETCRRNNWQTIEDPGFGKGYIAALAPWGEVLEGLKYLRAERRMNVILIGHTEIKRFDSPTSDPYSRYRVNLQQRAADVLDAAADIVGFVNFRVTLKNAEVGFNKKVTHGEGGGARVIYVEERPGFIAKNRFGMPPSLDYKKGEGWNALAKYMPEAAV